MSYVEQVLETHPRQGGTNREVMTEGIRSNWACAESCVACADACLGEREVESMLRCIRLCNDCADVCATTAKLLTRFTETDRALVRAQLQACVVATQICSAECEQHSENLEHCRVCGEVCRRCEAACKALILEE